MAYSAALVFVRGRPSIRADSGIFLSVAARLVHGDRLYSGVWDNKSPFFYYAQAVVFYIGGWRAPVLLDVAWTSIAAVAMWLLLRAAKGSPSTMLAGLVVYPLFLTGAWYHAGYSELPPLALAPVIGWLALRGNFFASGSLLTVALFFRLDYGLILLSVVAGALKVGAIGPAALRRSISHLLLGFAVAAAASLGLLAVRGELSPYVDTVRSQFGYPNRVLLLQGDRPNIIGHIRVVAYFLRQDRPRAALFVLIVATLAVLLFASLRRRLRDRNTAAPPELASPFTVFLVATAAAVAITLGFEATWGHSLEPIGLPATFGCCLLVSRLDPTIRSRRWRTGVIVAVVALCSVAFGGVSLASSASPQSNEPLSRWWRTPRSISALALDKEAKKVVRNSAGEITYARLGYNDDEAHAAFIHEPLKLACPAFHEYSFSTNLGQALACIRNRRPELVLVGPFFVADAFHVAHGRRNPWNAFVSRAEHLLHARYIEDVSMPDEGGTVQVWRDHPATPALANERPQDPRERWLVALVSGSK